MKKTFIAYLFIFLLCAIVYSNTIGVPFIWDDGRLILENGRVRDLSNFVSLAGTRYLTFLSFALNYKINGYAVAGYHIFNITIHSLNAILVYLLLVVISQTPLLSGSVLSRYSRSAALLTGLLFVSHPVHTMTVTNINQRSVLLATLFYLTSIISFIKARTTGREFLSKQHLAYYILSVVSAVFAMKCKEISFTLPPVILLLDRCFFGKEWSFKKSVLYALPLLCTLVIIPLDVPQPDVFNKKNESGAFRVEEGTVLHGIDARLSSISRKDYVLTELRVIPTYIRLFLLPVNLNLDYDYPLYSSLAGPEMLLSVLFILSLLAFAVFFTRSGKTGKGPARLISFGILWFFTTLSIESFAVVLKYVIFEYRLYLPSIGLIFLLAGTADYVSARLRNRTGYATIAIIAIIIIFSIAAHSRNALFKDEITLWEDVIKKAPLKAEAHNNLGFAYYRQNLLSEAVNEYRKALGLDPFLSKAHYNLGEVYVRKGLPDEAVQEYKTALKMSPDDSSAYNSLGNVYYVNGQFEEAAKEYKTALRLKPDNAQAHHNLGLVYCKQGYPAQAVREYKAALIINPNYLKAYYHLGNVYMNMGLTDNAIEQYRNALRIKPNLALFYNSLGLAYKQRGLTREAIQEFQTALKLQPDYADAQHNLGLLKR